MAQPFPHAELKRAIGALTLTHISQNLDLNEYLFMDDGSKASKPPPSSEVVMSMGVKDMKVSER